MQRKITMMTMPLIAGIAAGIFWHQTLLAEQGFSRTILQQKALEGVKGREITMFSAETAPGGMSGRHSHPGPEMLYIVEGTLTMEQDGKPTLTLKTGESYYSPARQVHNARNLSTTEKVKVIGFWVGKQGKPLASPAK